MKIYDNEGKTFDRYTILTESLDVFGMSENPASPQGFNQYCGNALDWGFTKFEHLGNQIELQELPKEVQQAIKKRKIA